MPHDRTPPWVRHAVLWHVYPLGFLGAPAQGDPGAEPVPRLRDLVGWLDYLVELGANGLLLGPVFQSESHGYDTTDHFRKALAEGPGSPYSSWFRWDRDGNPAVFEGHQHLVALDHGSPGVADHVTQVMRHWSHRGVDGWRLDAAYAVPRAFWSDVARRLRAELPDVWLLGEVIHGDYAAVIRESGLHSVTQYELWKAVWSGLNDRNLFELAHALQRHDALLEDCVPQTFVGNHDVTRLASRLTDPRHLVHALVVLFTVGGVPSVYSGDEQGLLGVKEDRAGGDDAVRPAFPPSPADLPSGGGPVLRLHQGLIALRRRHPWLHRARTTVEHLTNTGLLYRSEGADGERLLVALNLDDRPLTAPAPGGGWQSEAGAATASDGEVSVPAHGWGVWSG